MFCHKSTIILYLPETVRHYILCIETVRRVVMAQEVVKDTTAEKTPRRIWLFILIAVLPISLIALYYIYNGRQDIMDWVNMTIAAPYRDAMAKASSFGPFKYFSLAEVLITLIVLWALFYIVKTIIILITLPGRFANLGKRLYVMLVVGLYIFTAYSWTWGTGYHSTDLAGKTGLISNGITTEQLTNVTKLFAEKANELSGLVERDADRHVIVDTDYDFELSKGVYANISNEFPALKGTSYPPKAMMYSRLMSMIGFTGVYIAITGETNINVDAPAALIPATIAHEMAHQRGVNSEDEANFAGIAACITSNITIYEYSGYLDGLIYLSNALYKADPEAVNQIMSTFNDDVRRDWADNNDYWQQFESPAAEAVSAMYDGYLKSNGEELGVSSYGACVDMLASWLEPAAQPQA